MEFIFVGFIFLVVGLLLGSFGNVLIHRMPLDQSVVLPRSHCVNCKKPIAWYDNIPVFSWIVLRAQCRNCQQKISWRYPLVELLTGLLFLGVYLKYGTSYLAFEYCLLSFGLVVVSFIDFDHYIIPDEMSLGGIVVGLICAAINPERHFLDALLGVLAGGGTLWAVAWVYWKIRKEEGMGGGDIKLLAWIGSILGWVSIPFVILSSSILGSIVGIILMLAVKKELKSAIPFGPYISLGALIYIFGGDELAKWYLSLFFPEF